MKADNSDKGRIPVTLRIPERILEQIDTCVGQEDLPVSRNHWIVETLVEKLKQTKNGNGSNGSQ